MSALVRLDDRTAVNPDRIDAVYSNTGSTYVVVLLDYGHRVTVPDMTVESVLKLIAEATR